MEKTIIAEIDNFGKILGIYEKNKAEKLSAAKFKKVPNNSDLANILKRRVEMAERFYDPSGPAYAMAQKILNAFVAFSYPISVANHLAQYGYKNSKSIHSQLVASGEKLSIVKPNRNSPLPELFDSDILYSVMQNSGINERANQIVAQMHLNKNMGLNYAVAAYIRSFFVDMADQPDTRKHAFLLYFSFLDPDNAHKTGAQKAEDYAQLYGISTRTYYRTLREGIVLFAKSLWGELPGPESNDALEIIDGEIRFKKPEKN